jgi:hypothetical protein
MTPQTTQILEMSKTMRQVDVARQLKIAVSTVTHIIAIDKKAKEQAISNLQNQLKAEHLDLDADIAFELSNLCNHSFDKEKVECDLLDEFAEAYGITLTTLSDSYENKSEFLDFLKSKAYELY